MTATRVFALIIVLFIICGAIYVMTIPESGATAPIGQNETIEETPVVLPTYTSSEYGISFEYPDTYVLSEKDVPGAATRKHHAITLMDKIAAANIPEGGEGPTSITIELFQNNLDKQGIESWVKNTMNSNFKLSADQKLASSTVSGAPALGYTWDGLYRGDSLVFAHKGNIVMASVTYLTPSDQIRADFAAIVASISLQ